MSKGFGSVVSLLPGRVIVLQTLPGKRYNGTIFIYKNEAYMIGGMNNGPYANDFLEV